MTNTRLLMSSSKNIDIKEIDYSKDRILARFESELPESEDLEMLYLSVKKDGIIEPLIVRAKSNGRYEVVAGNRRLRAAKRAKLLTIPCVVRELNDIQARRLAFIENVNRKDLGPMQKAKGIAAIYKDVGISPEIAIMKIKHIHNLGPIKSPRLAFNSRGQPAKDDAQPTPEFIEAYDTIALSANRQYALLQLITDLPERTQEVIEEIKLPEKKAHLLTHSRLDKHPDIKQWLVKEIDDKKDDEGKIIRKVSFSEAQSKVRSTIDSLEKGSEFGKTIDHDTGEKMDFQQFPEVDKHFRVKIYEMHQDANKLIAKLLNRPLARGEYMYEKSIIDPKLQGLRDNMRTIQKDERERFAVTFAALGLICDTIVDSAESSG